jgi:aminoglycoside 3-N-acetyltransferase I
MEKVLESSLTVRRLASADLEVAHRVLRLMADVFDEGTGRVSDAYVLSLLTRPTFWLVAALENGEPLGGVTGHVLPMTRSESTELFIYDLAVDPAHQRRGVGTALVETLRREAAAAGTPVAFVPADNEDLHALAFYRAMGGDGAPVTIFTFEDA